jgi:hypothetical protein
MAEALLLSQSKDAKVFELICATYVLADTQRPVSDSPCAGRLSLPVSDIMNTHNYMQPTRAFYQSVSGDPIWSGSEQACPLFQGRIKCFIRSRRQSFSFLHISTFVFISLNRALALGELG